jgi:hypothetical protein
MKRTYSLSEIATATALSLGLAFACHGASAQDLPRTVTVTQQGNGNTSYADQSELQFAPDARITITQIGDHNHVGGPAGTTDGVIQLNNRPARLYAVVEQTGAGNNAGILQTENGGAIGEVSTRITQVGEANTAYVMQRASFDIQATVDQAGNGNVASIEQIGGTFSAHATQTGNDNRVTISVQDNGPFGGPVVTQTGDGNSATIVGNGAGLDSNPEIVQTGAQNTVTSVQTDIINGNARFEQYGVGNVAETEQSGDYHELDIDQNGNGNLARVSQTSPAGLVTGNRATIAQLGNSNTAIVRQVGADYVANVSQAGSGNYTSIYQH